MWGGMFVRGLGAIADDAASGKSKIGIIFKKIASHPIKVLASFLVAPILLIKVAMFVKNPIRRVVACIGLLLSLFIAYAAAHFLGSFVGSIFVATHVGLIAGLGFLIGTTLSVYLSVIFSIAMFNAVSFVFLKISSDEVLDYLNEITT